MYVERALKMRQNLLFHPAIGELGETTVEGLALASIITLARFTIWELSAVSKIFHFLEE